MVRSFFASGPWYQREPEREAWQHPRDKVSRPSMDEASISIQSKIFRLKMKHVNAYLGTRWMAIAWTLVILILISIPGSMIPKENKFLIPDFDKFVHAGIFGIFVWLWCLYYRRHPVRGRKLLTQFFFIFLVSGIYGITTEYIQKYLIPMRDFDKGDILADWTGAALGFIYCSLKLS